MNTISYLTQSFVKREPSSEEGSFDLTYPALLLVTTAALGALALAHKKTKKSACKPLGDLVVPESAKNWAVRVLSSNLEESEKNSLHYRRQDDQYTIFSCRTNPPGAFTFTVAKDDKDVSLLFKKIMEAKKVIKVNKLKSLKVPEASLLELELGLNQRKKVLVQERINNLSEKTIKERYRLIDPVEAIQQLAVFITNTGFSGASASTCPHRSYHFKSTYLYLLDFTQYEGVEKGMRSLVDCLSSEKQLRAAFDGAFLDQRIEDSLFSKRMKEIEQEQAERAHNSQLEAFYRRNKLSQNNLTPISVNSQNLASQNRPKRDPSFDLKKFEEDIKSVVQKINDLILKEKTRNVFLDLKDTFKHKRRLEKILSALVKQDKIFSFSLKENGCWVQA